MGRQIAVNSIPDDCACGEHLPEAALVGARDMGRLHGGIERDAPAQCDGTHQRNRKSRVRIKHETLFTPDHGKDHARGIAARRMSANGEHKAEEGEVVDGKAEHVHHGEGAHERERDQVRVLARDLARRGGLRCEDLEVEVGRREDAREEELARELRVQREQLRLCITATTLQP